jgi:radical SAM superfamily enzyme YgiQ (UPF0313 family)
MAHFIIWNSIHLNKKSGHTRPLGPYQLAGWLRRHGYTVKVIDFCQKFTTTELVDVTSKFVDSTTIAIGVSSTFWKDESLLAATREGRLRMVVSEPEWILNSRPLLENKFPKLKWLLGGTNSVASNCYLDWIRLHGHAEDSLLKFLDEESNVALTRKPFDILTLSPVFVKDDFVQPYEVLPIELGRGCQFACTFCRFPLLGKKKNTYLRDYSLVKEEFIHNYETFGTTRYFFIDDTVNESQEKMEAVTEIVQNLPFKLEWIGYNRLDLIGSRPGSIQQLKDSGLKSAYFGIESFHKDASKIVGKGWNGVHGKEFLQKLKQEWKDEISFELSFIAGLTGETREDLYETHQWCIDNDMYDWRFNALGISRDPNLIWKSKFDENYSQYGYRFMKPLQPEWWENDYWDAKAVSEFCRKINGRMDRIGKPASWRLGEHASAGFSFDEIMTTPKNELNYDLLTIKNNEFYKNYLEYNLKSS